MERISSEYLISALAENEHRLRQILSDSFIDDANEVVHEVQTVADDASCEKIEESAAFASDSFALRLLAVLYFRTTAPPGIVWNTYGDVRARALDVVLRDTSYQMTIFVQDSRRLVDTLIALSVAEFRTAWLLFENPTAVMTVVKQLILDKLRILVREEVRAVPHDQLVLCSIAFALFSYTERLKRSVAYVEAHNLIAEAASQLQALFDMEAICHALEQKCGDIATSFLTSKDEEKTKSIRSMNNLLIDNDDSKEEVCASVVHGYVVYTFVRDSVRRRRVSQAIYRVANTAEHKCKQLSVERPIRYAHIASMISVVAKIRQRLWDASVCSALTGDLLDFNSIELKLTATIRDLFGMVSQGTITWIRLLISDLAAVKQVVSLFNDFLSSLTSISFEEKVNVFGENSLSTVELLQCFATENQHCFDQYRSAFTEILELIKVSRYYHYHMNANLKLCNKVIHHCEQLFHVIKKPIANIHSEKAAIEQRQLVSVIAEAPVENGYLSQLVADHYPEIFIAHLQAMLMRNELSDQHLVHAVFNTVLQSETDAFVKVIALLNVRPGTVIQHRNEENATDSCAAPSSAPEAVSWRQHSWYAPVLAVCAENLALVLDQWLVDSTNLEQFTARTVLATAIAHIPLPLFSVPTIAQNTPLALVIAIDAFNSWARPIFDFASNDDKLGVDRRISAVVQCYIAARSLAQSPSNLPPVNQDGLFRELMNKTMIREIWAKSKLKKSSDNHEALTDHWIRVGRLKNGHCSSSVQKDFISVIMASAT